MSERNRFLRFATVGAVVAVYYLVAFWGLSQVFDSPWIANFWAFGSAVLIQYIGQTVWTFGKLLAVPAQIGKFLCMIGVGLIFSSAVTGVLGPQIGLSKVTSALIVVALLPFINFVFLRYWVYREQNST